MRHTLKDAHIALHIIKVTINPEAKLIGGFSKGKRTSDHDIDILLPGMKSTVRLANKLRKVLGAWKFRYTEWGTKPSERGMFFYGTIVGNVDIFFTTKDFDY